MTPDQLLSVGASFGKKIYSVFSKDITKYIKDFTKDIKNSIYSSSNEYVQRFVERHGYVKVLRMPVAVKIEEIFINVRVIEEVNYSKFLSEEKLYETLKAQDARLGEIAHSNNSHESGIEVANMEKYLLLLGAPGGGKSTLLRKVGIESLKESTSTKNLNSLIPVFVELKNISVEKSNLLDYLIEEFKVTGFPEPEAFVKTGLKKGYFLILLDGLDEVPKAIINSFQNQVEQFVDTYSKNRYIISCRVAAKPGGFKRFKNIEILPFTVSEIEEFAKKWFSTPLDITHKTADHFVERINDPLYIATRELASTPLLLTMLCLVFNSEQDFPKNRAVLYKQAIDVLLKEWSSEKKINRDPIYKDLTIPLEELMLSKLSYENFIKDNLFFNETYLNSFISKFLNDNINAPKFLDASTILNEISLQQGLLVERAANIYSFSHLTFQEFFTAKYIDDFQLVSDIIPKKLLDNKWREVFLLLAGLMKTGADKLIFAIFNELAKVKQNDLQLSRYFDQYRKVIDITNVSLKEKLMISTIILYILSTHKENASLFVVAIKKLDYELGQNLDSTYISDGYLNSEFRWNILIRFLNDYSAKREYPSLKQIRNLMSPYTYQTIDRFRAQIRRLGNIQTTPGFSTLSNYGRVLVFLLECKRNALYISNSIWEEIEAKLL